MPRKGPLSGVRILELTQAHAGPFGGQLLGDLGAEMLKIEPPGIGELNRSLTPRLGEPELGFSDYFLALNRNKKSLTLDLYTPAGKQAFYDLVTISDVVYDNYRAGVPERLGIDYETLKKMNPRIIACSIVGYGSSGPYSTLPSYDDIAQAITGMKSLCGNPDDSVPIRSPVALGDISAGIFSAMGIIAALYERERTGKGQRVNVNLIDSCMALMSSHFQHYFVSGKVPEAQGARHPILPFVGAFQTRDGYIALGPCWPRIARAVNKEYLMSDPRFQTIEGRFAHKQELEDEVEDALRQFDTDIWVDIFRLNEIPAAPVKSLDEAVADPQVTHNGIVKSIRHPKYGLETRVIGCPIRMDSEEGEDEFPPAKGEHTEAILRNILGYDDNRIRQIQEEADRHFQELRSHVRHAL